MTVYVTGGGGTHLEPRIAGYYLAALLAETGARGVPGRVVAVKTQQSEIDAPLDDLVVEGLLADGTATRLDLQITTTLSFTESDKKWADIVPRAWATYRQDRFDPTTRRLGIAVSQATTKLERSVQPLLARARHAIDAQQFRTRLARPKGANEEQREFQRVLDLLVRFVEPAATDEDILAFSRCLTIIPFDLDQEDASRDAQASVDRLAQLLRDPTETQKLWASLAAMAARIIPSGGGVERPTLARALQVEGYVVGADRRRGALIAALDAESKTALASIRDTIGGQTVARDEVHEQIVGALAEVRMLRIVGEHGTGKSALLKRLVMEEPAGAPVLVFKDLRIGPGGWPAHASRFGPVATPVDLLRELALSGSRTLFIDGLDKILDPAVQVTVNDLVAAITTAPELDAWRIAATLREENVTRVDAWLDPAAFSKLAVRSVRVEAFDDEEAREAAAALPALRPLLSDPQNYDKVLRRPFFLEALSRLPMPAEGEVSTEMDLVDLWWRHGGADASDFAPAQHRRNIIRSLGEMLLSAPGAPLPVRDLDPIPLDELRRAGVLRDVALGTTVAFSHDIYEEWALHRVLGERRSDIARTLLDGDQDLQLARPLQLLATEVLERADGAEWNALLTAVEPDKLRATWSRVILTAPVRSVRSQAMLDRIASSLMVDDGALLGRLLLAVRTTETERNLRFLDGELIPGLSPDEREQMASAAASPHLLSWLRLLDWLVPKLDTVPASARGELYPLLDGWAQFVGPINLPQLHVPTIAAWARAQIGDLDAQDGEQRSWERNALRKEAQPARSLLMQCAAAAPGEARAHLASMTDDSVKRLRRDIMRGSTALAQALPTESAAFVKRAYLLEHDWRRRSRSTMAERSENMGFDDNRDFYPASPHRPPLLALLRAHPSTGLGLVCDLCNHAMEGWRRRRRNFDAEPLPITIDLGRGPAQFWGDHDSYRWFRGTAHVHLLDSALMALEVWALERLQAGEDLDTVCRKVTEGNQCNAVLGIAAGLCAVDNAASLASEAALAIVTHPALWDWDITRSVTDQTTAVNLIGHWGAERHLQHALAKHNELPHRRVTVRDLALLFAGLSPPETRKRYTDAIGTFLERMPLADTSERDDPERLAAARRHYERFLQQADPANVRSVEKDGRVYLTMEPPYAAMPEHQEMLAEQANLNRVLRLHLWSLKAVESGTPAGEIGLREAYDEMLALDEDGLLDATRTSSDLRVHHAQSAVAATAAVLARHADEGLWSEVAEKVTDVIGRAATISETEDALSIRSAHVSGHPPAMAAHGYAALVRRAPLDEDARAALLQLAVDPIDKVAEAAHDAAAILADVDPYFVWRLYCLATQRAARSQAQGHDLLWSREEAIEQSVLAEEAEQAMRSGRPAIAHPGPAVPARLRLDPNEPDGDDDEDEHREDGDDARFWSGNEHYDWDYQANALRLSVAPMLGERTRAQLLENAGSFVDRALASRDEDRSRSDPSYEWLFAFGAWLGRLLGHLSADEVDALLFERVDRAAPRAAGELMDTIMRNFMIDWMLLHAPLEDRVFAHWSTLVAWAAQRPAWNVGARTERVDEHDRGMALASLFCVAGQRLVCGVETEWPHLAKILPTLENVVPAFAGEKTVFAGLLKLVRAAGAGLQPEPGLPWIRAVVRSRRKDRAFWEHLSNGEQLVILLREIIAAGELSSDTRAMTLEAADALIEAGVRGAAHLQQDMVRLGR